MTTTPTPTTIPSLSLVTTPSPHAPAAPFPRTLDLLRGHPRTTLLPTADLYGSASIALHTPALLPSDSYSPTRHPLHYGPDLGNLTLRTEIGRWVASRYGLPGAVPAEHINLTNGASYGLAALLRDCASPHMGYTRAGFLVSPTYFLAARAFEDAGFAGRLEGVRGGPGEGVDFEGMERRILELEAEAEARGVTLEDGLRPILREGVDASRKRIFKYVLYCVPTYSNPTGETWDLATRLRAVELARKYDILIICDDVYDFLGNHGDLSSINPDDGNLLPRLVTIDKQLGVDEHDAGHVVSNCSFSKLLGPGLRLGWMETSSPVLATQVGEGGANHSGGTPSHFVSCLVLPLLLPHSPRQMHRKIDLIIRQFRDAYTANCEAARRAIKEHFPEGTEIWGAKGGFFMWVVLPEDVDARRVVRIAAEREGIIVASGDMSECPGDRERNWMDWGKRAVRVSVSYCSEGEMVEGIRRLGCAVRRWKEAGTTTVEVRAEVNN